MKPYADTNFFTRLYLALESTPEAESLLGEAKSAGAEVLPAIPLHYTELANAFQLHVFHGKERGHIRVTPEQAAVAWETFLSDSRDGGFVIRRRLSESELERQAVELSLRHTAKHGFRTYDLLHVSASLILGCDTFWSYDVKCSKLAKLEGLRTLWPT